MKYFTRKMLQKYTGIFGIVFVFGAILALSLFLKNNNLLFTPRATGGPVLSVNIPTGAEVTKDRSVILNVSLNSGSRTITRADIKVVADEGITILAISAKGDTLPRIFENGAIATDGRSATISLGSLEDARSANGDVATVTVIFNKDISGTKKVSIDTKETKLLAVGFPDSVLDGAVDAVFDFTSAVTRTPIGTPVVDEAPAVTAAKTACKEAGGEVVITSDSQLTVVSAPTYDCVDTKSKTVCELMAFYNKTCVFPADDGKTVTPSPSPTVSTSLRETPIGPPETDSSAELEAAKAMCTSNGGSVVGVGDSGLNSSATSYQCVDKLSGVVCDLIAFYKGTCIFPTSMVTTIAVTPTNEVGAPVVAIGSISNVATSSFAVNSTVTSDNGSALNECGFLYSKTNSTPTIGTATKKTASCSSNGAYNADIAGLAANTTYYVRAYSINNGYVTTGYSVVLSVKTKTSGSTTSTPAPTATSTGTIVAVTSVVTLTGTPSVSATISGTPSVTSIDTTQKPRVTVTAPVVTDEPTTSSTSTAMTIILIIAGILTLGSLGYLVWAFFLKKS